MDINPAYKKKILSSLLTSFSDLEKARKYCRKQLVITLVVAFGCLAIALPLLGFTEKRHYLLLFMVWLSGNMFAIAIMVKNSAAYTQLLKQYVDVEKIRSDLSDEPPKNDVSSM